VELGASNICCRSHDAVTTAIREFDTNRIVFIEGNDCHGLRPDPALDDNFVYSFHKYWNSNGASSISGYIALQIQHALWQ
jgi:hypothetical protein